MNADELRALAERVQGLDGPDREVDALIFMALNKPDWRDGEPWKKTNGWFKPNNANNAFDYFFHDGMGGRTTRVPQYTASLDAAMTLLDAKGWHWRKLTKDSVSVYRKDPAKAATERFDGYGSNDPCRMTAAYLLALADSVAIAEKATARASLLQP